MERQEIARAAERAAPSRPGPEALRLWPGVYHLEAYAGFDDGSERRIDAAARYGAQAPGLQSAFADAIRAYLSRIGAGE